MITYLIDENMPFLPFWNKERFVHFTDIPAIHFDTDIWNYALNNGLIIITKDSDFYNRYLSSQKNPKVVWIRTGNLKRNSSYNWSKMFGMMLKKCFWKIPLSLLMKIK